MWTGDEIKQEAFYIKGVDYRCPFCFEVVDLDDEDEEFYVVNGEIYHKDCLYAMVERYGAQYISENDLKEYAGWFLDATFHSEPPMWVQDVILADADDIYNFIMDGMQEDMFLEWYDEKIEKELSND